MEIVIPVRKGGLGNQLFQIAAGLIVQFTTGKKIVLPEAQEHIHSTKRYEDTIFRNFKDRLPNVIDDNIIKILKEQGYAVYPGEPGFESWSPAVCTPGPLILHGYFQYAPLIEKHLEKLREIFLAGLEDYLKKGNPTEVAVHVRRGDYFSFPDIFHILDISYYARAIQEIEKRVSGKKTYKIFSNDIEWCKQQDVFLSLEDVIFVDESNEIKSFCQMIQCEGGCIGGNSSFSWWAACLGAHRVNAPCIFPKDWVKNANPQLLLSNWIEIPAIEGSVVFYPPGYLNLHEARDIYNIIKPIKGTVEIYADTEEYHPTSNPKVYFQCEPQAIQKTDSYILNNASKYTTVLTYNPKVLQECPNSKLIHLPACSWISGTHFRSLDVAKKQFQISSITGSKQFAEGHTFRLQLYANQIQVQEHIGVPMTWFRSSAGQALPELSKNPFIYKDKFPLFETYQYSLVIENSSQQDYFTEKLIDCLVTKTIPIYYGCPNIHEFFDTTGWIILTEPDTFNRVNEFIYKWKLANYTSESYSKLNEFIQRNFELCKQKYLGFYTRINRTLLQLPEFA